MEEDIVLCRWYIANTTGTLEGALAVLKITDPVLHGRISGLLTPLISAGKELMPRLDYEDESGDDGT